jgi:hypothetical protein
MRETPMRRGAVPLKARQLTRDIARAIASADVPPALARRVAFQLVFKFHWRDLFDEPEWIAAGGMLRREIARLRSALGMGLPRIVAVLPKVSADRLIEFYDELTKTDARIARTILHAAANTSDPLAIGRRYLADYRLIARKVRAVDPAMARSVAAATFTAGAPLSKAMEYVKQRAKEHR